MKYLYKGTKETRQEIYNKVCSHAMKQYARALHAPAKCVYRAKDGKQCFVGILIPDRIQMEGNSALALRHYALWGVRIGTFLNKLQSIHDDCGIEEWYKELYQLGINHKLDTSCLEAAAATFKRNTHA